MNDMTKPNEPKSTGQPTSTATADLAAVLAASRQKQKGRWLKRSLVSLVVLAVVAGGGLYLYSRQGAGEVSYTTQPVKSGDLTVLVTATGSVQPTEQVDISSELSGTVRDVNVDYNSEVKAGDVLAVLDTIKVEADVKSTQAKLDLGQGERRQGHRRSRIRQEFLRPLPQPRPEQRDHAAEPRGRALQVRFGCCHERD